VNEVVGQPLAWTIPVFLQVHHRLQLLTAPLASWSPCGDRGKE
jgi:hypothetical protein